MPDGFCEKPLQRGSRLASKAMVTQKEELSNPWPFIKQVTMNDSTFATVLRKERNCISVHCEETETEGLTCYGWLSYK
jgi:hypothetical protein